MFDPQTFLSQSVTGPLSTRVDPVAVGDYRAIADKLELRKAGTGADASNILRVTWKLVDAAELTAIGREAANVRQDIFLDLDDAGNLDTSKGKNVGLGRLLETFGLNAGGTPIGAIKGQVAIIKVGHRPDKKDSSIVFDEVTRVAALT